MKIIINTHKDKLSRTEEKKLRSFCYDVFGENAYWEYTVKEDEV